MFMFGSEKYFGEKDESAKLKKATVIAIAHKAENVISRIKDGTITTYNRKYQLTIHNALFGNPDPLLLWKLVNDLMGLPEPMRIKAKNMLGRLKNKQARAQTGTKQ